MDWETLQYIKALADKYGAKAISEEDRKKVYKVLTDNGPDVDFFSAKFGRLVGMAVRAGVVNDPKKLYAWLEKQGMFGPKLDSLRGEGDRYY